MSLNPTIQNRKPTEHELFLALLRDICNSVPLEDRKRGRPSYPLRDGIFCATQKVYSQFSGRRALGLHHEAHDRSLLNRRAYGNIASRVLTRSDVTPILHDLIVKAALPLAHIEEHFGVDSTGFVSRQLRDARPGQVRKARGWIPGQETETRERPREHVWLKAHACFGLNTGIAAQVVITAATGPNTGDTKQFEPLVRGAHRAGFTIKRVSADKAYANRANFNVADDIGATPYIPPRANDDGRSCGSPLWHRMYHYYQAETEAFYKIYHQRSKAESAFSSLKNKFDKPLMSRSTVAMENELLCKFLAYNITKVIAHADKARLDLASIIGLRGLPAVAPTTPGNAIKVIGSRGLRKVTVAGGVNTSRRLPKRHGP